MVKLKLGKAVCATLPVATTFNVNTTTAHLTMASHVPFLAVRPDDQFSTEVKPRDFALTNAVEPTAPMDSPPPLTRAPPTQAVTRIPAYLRLPLIVALSLGLNTVLRSLTADISGLQFAPASRDATDRPELVAALLGWKVVELFIAWTAAYDYEDLAALALLTNRPYYHLLNSFWSVEFVPILISVMIDVAAVSIPFALLRPLTRLHDPQVVKTANQRLSADWQIMGLTTVLAASVYAVTFSLLYYFNFGVFLIQHFDNIPSLETAHESNLPRMLLLFVGSGAAAMYFLFRPTLAAAGKPSLTETKAKGRRTKKFNAETATFGETLAHNLGIERQPSHRAQVLFNRTLVLVVCTIANTFVRVFGTIEGTDIAGSLGYAGLWAMTHALVGVVYAWLGNEQ